MYVYGVASDVTMCVGVLPLNTRVEVRVQPQVSSVIVHLTLATMSLANLEFYALTRLTGQNAPVSACPSTVAAGI